jgi:putative hemolysin
MNPEAIYGILISLIFSAFFSGIEIAFISSNKLHIELLKQQGKYSAKLISKFYANPSMFIGTCLIGNTLSLVVFGIYMAEVLDPLITANLPFLQGNEAALLLVQTVASTVIVLITAEFLPKSLFMINPESLLLRLAMPFRIIHLVLAPFSYTIIGAAKWFLKKVLRAEIQEDKTVFGLTDLSHYIRTTMRHEDEAEDPSVDSAIFHNALQFKSLKVRDCMIPRADIEAVEINEGLDYLKDRFIGSGHSKILVFRDNIDNILGYCHANTFFKRPRNLESIITPITVVPETLPANELLIKFTSSSKSIALVVDEYGGTSGLVTIEDVMEEIFGEIRDEFDKEEYTEVVLGEGKYQFSARLEIDYLNEKYHLDIPMGDYETLGGFILSQYEDLPQSGDVIDLHPFLFEILKMDEARIDTVELLVREEE